MQAEQLDEELLEPAAVPSGRVKQPEAPLPSVPAGRAKVALAVPSCPSLLYQPALTFVSVALTCIMHLLAAAQSTADTACVLCQQRSAAVYGCPEILVRPASSVIASRHRMSNRPWQVPAKRTPEEDELEALQAEMAL